MEHTPFHLKYRPASFDDFIGNRTSVKSLRDTIGNLHMYLFHGEKGCGKTTLGRIVMTELEIQDVTEADAASNRGIDAARQLRAEMNYKPLQGKRKGYIIDECHSLTKEAQEAWLKVLEEPPDHAFFVFCTTELQKVMPTIRSRAARYQVGPLTKREMLNLLSRVSLEEELELHPSIVEAITDASGRVPRDALILLEQVKDFESKKEALTFLDAYTGEESADVRKLCQLMLRKQGWKDAQTILKGLDKDAGENTRRAILGYLQKVALDSKQPNPRVASLLELFMDNVYDSGKAGLVGLVMRSYL